MECTHGAVGRVTGQCHKPENQQTTPTLSHQCTTHIGARLWGLDGGVQYYQNDSTFLNISHSLYSVVLCDNNIIGYSQACDVILSLILQHHAYNPLRSCLLSFFHHPYIRIFHLATCYSEYSVSDQLHSDFHELRPGMARISHYPLRCGT